MAPSHHSPDDPGPPSASSLGHAAFQLWLLNVLVGTIVGSLWLFRMPEDLSLGLRFYVALALVSSVATLGLIPAGLFALAHFIFLRRRRGSEKKVEVVWPLGLVQSFTGAMFLACLFTDTVIYKLLRYHANGAALNAALTEGSGDAIHLENLIWTTSTVVIVSLSAIQFAFWRWRLTRSSAAEVAGRRPSLLLRPRIVLLAGLLPLVSIEKSVYAMASFHGDRELLYASRPLPGPKPRLTRLPEWIGGESVQHEVMPKEARLAYPLAVPELPSDGPRPNVLFVVLDSWRRDAFSASATPNLHAFSQEARVFDDHASGGNGTRFGLFSMLYGLHGSYWFRVLEERRTPVLIDSLQEEGYDMRVWSSASMNFPEFRATAWAGLPDDAVIDRFLGERGLPLSKRSDKKDALVRDAFGSWLEQRQADEDERPFFGFVLLDSPHQPYFNPGGPNHPSLENLSYLELGLTPEGPELESLKVRMRNSYLNSVLYADMIAGQILDQLEAAGELENTVVVVTGDHGEEFYESGFWGHTSNFTPEQLNVPLFVRGPGVVAGREHRPTSHLDVSNSLLELLGADPARRAGYSLGASLFEPLEERERVVGAWAHLGVLTPSGIVQLPLKVGAEEIWVFRDDWTPFLDVPRRLNAESDALQRTAEECRRFLEIE